MKNITKLGMSLAGVVSLLLGIQHLTTGTTENKPKMLKPNTVRVICAQPSIMLNYSEPATPVSPAEKEDFLRDMLNA
ncbi:hypothetical protein ACFL6Y_09995 [Elusimicrobiota bacterium]